MRTARHQPTTVYVVRDPRGKVLLSCQSTGKVSSERRSLLREFKGTPGATVEVRKK